LPLVGTTNNSAVTASTTPFLASIQQQIQQHELNKELKLLRTEPANTNTFKYLMNFHFKLSIIALFKFLIYINLN
jgi:hypothetical protein